MKDARLTSFALFACFWSLGAGVLVYSYSSIVASSLTLPRTKSPINSFEDLLASNEIYPLLRTDLYAGMLIMVAVVSNK